MHQAGTAEELARVLGGELKDSPVATRSFEEREAPYRAMDDADLWGALVRRVSVVEVPPDPRLGGRLLI